MSQAPEAGWSEVPLIVVARNDAHALDLLRAGAADALAPDELSTSRLVRTICRAIERRRAGVQSRRASAASVDSHKLEAIGGLARGIAHELNNILMVVLGMGEMVFTELPPGSPLRDDVKEIVEAGERGAAVTSQLLTFARTDAARPEIIDLNVRLERSRAALQGLLGPKVRLELALGAGIQPIKADPAHFDELFQCLAENAREAMPDGGVFTIRSSNARCPEGQLGQRGGDHVQLLVSDTGVGMDDTTRERAFEPFFSSKTNQAVSGLGLATAYGVVSHTGGQITIDSALGRGTTIQILIPAYREISSATLRVRAGAAEVVGPPTVMLVEDTVSVRKLAARALEARGLQVVEASHGRLALDLIQKYGAHSIDLLITDSVMPDLDGVELASRLREQRADLPIIFMSGRDETAAHGDLLADARSRFLRKPFATAHLLEAVEAFIEA